MFQCRLLVVGWWWGCRQGGKRKVITECCTERVTDKVMYVGPLSVGQSENALGFEICIQPSNVVLAECRAGNLRDFAGN